MSCVYSKYVQHVFFECVVVKQCWVELSNIFNVSLGDDLTDIGKFQLSDKKHGLSNIITYVVLWSIWKFNTELCFHNSDQRSMGMLLSRIYGILQNWRALYPLMKRESR